MDRYGRPESMVLLARAERLVTLEETGAPLVMRRHELRLIEEALDGVIQACIDRGESLIDPEIERAVEARLLRLGGAA